MLESRLNRPFRKVPATVVIFTKTLSKKEIQETRERWSQLEDKASVYLVLMQDDNINEIRGLFNDRVNVFVMSPHFVEVAPLISALSTQTTTTYPLDVVFAFGISDNLYHGSLAKGVSVRLFNFLATNKNVSFGAFKHGATAQQLFPLQPGKDKARLSMLLKSIDVLSSDVDFESATQFASERMFQLGTGFHKSHQRIIFFITNKQPKYSIQQQTRELVSKGVNIVVIGIGEDVTRSRLV